MRPDDYRTLASRAETEEPTEALNEDVARALDGWWWDSGEAEWVSDEGCTTQELPAYLTDLTTAASAMPEGWTVCRVEQSDDGWIVGLMPPPRPRAHGTIGMAPEFASAWMAAILRAIALNVERETTNAG